ncbi:transposase [Leptospira sp. GIMC2001]|uniref:transposase n=1 Tax=Leptospira sp. GIMC2001 TaxID=1513297 RepID=UPI00234B0B40|nr:transposase [Leptospira sp. GIMC2001]WCL50977.1 transposase [Leptospira sp. GIMC2001]
MGQCPICKAQKSLAKGTPLMNLHLPMSYFSYILQEILIAYPSVLTAKAIQKKLVLKSYSSAWLLKKRIQIFMTHLNDSMMEQTKEALSQEASMNMGSKMPFSGDVSDSIKGRIITNVDTLAIFSVGVRANKFRSRYRHGGITSSIYQSAKVGGAQVGTLASNITIKGSLSFYESHPLTNTDYALSHLEKVITPENVLMADEAYQGLFGHYRNIRTINHSRRANKKIHVFSRERWSKDGVHSNVVEGSNGILKKAMKQYNWFNCKYSQLYLNEFAVGKNIRFFDAEKNVIFGIGDTSKNCGKKIREIRPNNYNSIRELLKNLTYRPITTEERKLGEVGNLRNNLSISELSKLPKLLQDAIKKNDTQVATLRGSRLRSERSLKFSQRKLLSCLNIGEWNTLEDVARIANVNYREALHIIKKLTLVGILDTVIYQTGNEREKVRIKLKVAIFYKIILTSNIGEFHNLKKQFDRKATRYKAKPKYRGFKKGSRYD